MLSYKEFKEKVLEDYNIRDCHKEGNKIVLDINTRESYYYLTDPVEDVMDLIEAIGYEIDEIDHFNSTIYNITLSPIR